MRLHRFYIDSDVELKHDFWLHDDRLISQWTKVLRFRAGEQVVLFNDIHERLYKIVEITPREAHLQYITDFERKVPKREVYLLWSLLKKDKNDWVLQKCTELGVSHFIPLVADRSEKTGFDETRARKIVVEAAEQCGRSDIPAVREPINVDTALEEFGSKIILYICEQDGEDTAKKANISLGVLIGPEGGWSDREKQLFTDKSLKHLNVHDFTLRAETACVSAATLLTT